jgi:hypothetical protein
VNYIDAHSKIIISCKIHGDFEQKANSHLNGHGCYMCCNGFSKQSILWLDFLSKYYNINIQRAENDGEYLIPETKYSADGFCKKIILYMNFMVITGMVIQRNLITMTLMRLLN